MAALSPTAAATLPEAKAADVVAGAADAILPATLPTGVPKMTHNCMQGVVTVIRSWTSDETNCICRIVAYVVTIFLSLLATATVAGIPFVWLAYQEHGVQKAEAHYMKYPVIDETAVSAEEHEELSAELETAKKEIAAKEGALTVAQQAVIDVKAQLEAAKASAGVPSAEVDDLKAKLDTEKSAKAALEERATKAETSVKALTKTNADLQVQVETTGKQLATHTAEVDTLGEQLSVANGQVASLSGELASAKSQLTAAQQKATRLESLKGDQAKAMEKAVADATTPLQTQIEQLSKEITGKQGIVIDLQSQLSAATTSAASLESQLRSAKEAQEALASRLTDLQKKCDASEQAAKKAEAELDKVQKERSKDSVKFLSLQGEHDGLKTALETEKATHEITVEQRDLLKGQNDKLKGDLDVLNGRVIKAEEAARADHDAAARAAKLAQENARLTQEKADLTSQFGKMKTQADIDRAVNAAKAGLRNQEEFEAALKAAMADMESELATTKDLLSKAQITLGGKASAVHEQNAALLKQVQEREGEITKLRRELRDQVAKTDATEKSLATVRSELATKTQAANVAAAAASPAKAAAPAKAPAAPKPEQKAEKPADGKKA